MEMSICEFCFLYKIYRRVNTYMIECSKLITFAHMCFPVTFYPSS
jgi:hypothetical protein